MPASPYVMDSSVGMSFFHGNPAVHRLVIKSLRESRIIVPAICLFEVALAVGHRIGEHYVKVVIANMREQTVDDITTSRALAASYIRNERKLSMADAIVYASTNANNVTLSTHDRGFEGLPNVLSLKTTT